MTGKLVILLFYPLADLDCYLNFEPTGLTKSNSVECCAYKFVVYLYLYSFI
jgi:hypothetical protein